MDKLFYFKWWQTEGVIPITKKEGFQNLYSCHIDGRRFEADLIIDPEDKKYLTETREEALQKAQALKDKKIVSLKKQLEKLESGFICHKLAYSET